MSTPPEDAASKEPSDSTGAPDDGQPQSNAENRELGPWFALLRVAVGNRMPEGPLGARDSPTVCACDPERFDNRASGAAWAKELQQPPVPTCPGAASGLSPHAP